MNKINNIQVRLHILFPSTIAFNDYMPAYAMNVRYIIIGYESEGVWKPVPGKALLPVLESPPSTPTRLTPTPPKSQPPTDASRPSRM